MSRQYNNNKKPTPFYAPESETPVLDDEIKRREYRHERLLKLGIDTTQLDGEEYGCERENPYRLQIILLVNQDKEIPKDLIDRMKRFDKGIR